MSGRSRLNRQFTDWRVHFSHCGHLDHHGPVSVTTPGLEGIAHIDGIVVAQNLAAIEGHHESVRIEFGLCVVEDEPNKVIPSDNKDDEEYAEQTCSHARFDGPYE